MGWLSRLWSQLCGDVWRLLKRHGVLPAWWRPKLRKRFRGATNGPGLDTVKFGRAQRRFRIVSVTVSGKGFWWLVAG